MIAEVRVSIYSPNMTTCLVRDIVEQGDLAGGRVSYEDTPSGNGAGQLDLGLHYEELDARGYYAQLGIVEISTADDTLQAPIAAGATKLYVSSTLAYSIASGEDTQQLFLRNGSTLVMGIPVTSVGTDGGGAYCIVTPPITMPGNPSVIPAMPAGTIVGRRRYSGVIRRRDRSEDFIPKSTIALGPVSSAFDEVQGGYTIGSGAAVDVTTAILTFLLQYASRWPQLTISAGNFATATGQTFSGSQTQTTVGRMIADALGGITNGDSWTVRVGHDRKPRMLKLYTSSSNTYAYPVTFTQGTTAFEPTNISVQDAQTSGAYNSIQVFGGTNPATQQPYSAIVQDAASISTVIGRQIDGNPVTNTSCMSVAACAAYGQSLLNAQATGRLQGSFRILTVSNGVHDFAPQGLADGDAIRGINCVTLAGFLAGAPSVYGLASSVVSTIDINSGTRYQDVTFAPIEPDWMAAVAERDNANATSLHANTGTGNSISSFTVSPNAYPPIYSAASLTVGTPAFKAIFAAGTAQVDVPAALVASFGLTANTTTWVSLNASLAWVQSYTSTPIAGTIPYGFFSTNASGVVGFTQSASVGIGPTAPIGTTLTVGSPTIAYNGSGGAAPSAVLTGMGIVVTPPAADPRPFAQWGAGFEYWSKINDSGTSDGDTNVLNYASAGTYNGTAIPTTDTFGPLAAGHAYQLAVQWIDQHGTAGPLVVIALTVAKSVDGGNITGGSVGTTQITDGGVTTGKIHAQAVSRDQVVGGAGGGSAAQPQNLLFNPRFLNLSLVSAVANGWSVPTGSSSANPTFQPTLGRAYFSGTNITTGGVPTIQQLVPYAASSGLPIVFSGEIYVTTASNVIVGPRIYAYDAYGTSLGLVNYVNYSAAQSGFQTFVVAAPASAIPAGTAFVSATFICQGTSATNSLTAFFTKPQIEYGLVPSPYSEDVGASLASFFGTPNPPGSTTPYTGNSTPYNGQASMLPVPSDFSFVYAFATGTTTVNWYACGQDTTGTPVSGQDITFRLPDGSTIVAPHQHTSGATQPFDAGATNVPIYVLAKYNPNTGGGWTITLQTTPFAPATLAASYQDGYVALVSSYAASQIAGRTGTMSGGYVRGGKLAQ